MGFDERFLRVLPPLNIGGQIIKRYHLNARDAELAPEVVKEAEAFLPQLLPDRGVATPASFLILHQGEEAYYVNLYTWVWDGIVLECHVAIKGNLPILEGATELTKIDQPWAAHIWELPMVTYERSAWVRHMLKQIPDLDAYLSDSMPSGPVGAN
ncbi:hypothetical protein [Spongiactinospora sp. TRM90649]|uniref:hypothetical protein n=1 Tax=Spongiactinospora sp. TRM90649 TaxID=3031114 RepID=UPI0023FA3036|nr:hypothetical protein [Spongiactinospora sp. TRM90649]MDF5752917.1 hypothetical protein [Spongiactinospora sp. TRM90649]